jgi:hypothetical protein
MWIAGRIGPRGRQEAPAGTGGADRYSSVAGSATQAAPSRTTGAWDTLAG